MHLYIPRYCTESAMYTSAEQLSEEKTCVCCGWGWNDESSLKPYVKQMPVEHPVETPTREERRPTRLAGRPEGLTRSTDCGR